MCHKQKGMILLVDIPFFAKDLFPNGCSCGINYEELGMSYHEHLILEHLIDDSDKELKA